MKNNDITCSARSLWTKTWTLLTPASISGWRSGEMQLWAVDNEKLDEQKEGKIISKDICGAMDPVWAQHWLFLLWPPPPSLQPGMLGHCWCHRDDKSPHGSSDWGHIANRLTCIWFSTMSENGLAPLVKAYLTSIVLIRRLNNQIWVTCGQKNSGLVPLFCLQYEQCSGVGISSSLWKYSDFMGNHWREASSAEIRYLLLISHNS